MMKMTREQRKTGLPLILGMLPFAATAIDAFGENQILMGSANLLVCAANAIALKYIDKMQHNTNIVLFLINAAVALIVSYAYFQEGKKGLPYAWLLVCIVFVGAAFFVQRKKKSG